MLNTLDPDWLLTPNMVGNLYVYADAGEGCATSKGFIDFLFDGDFESFDNLVGDDPC